MRHGALTTPKNSQWRHFTQHLEGCSAYPHDLLPGWEAIMCTQETGEPRVQLVETDLGCVPALGQVIQCLFNLSLPWWLRGKESTCSARVSILGSGRFPGKEMATHSSILALKIPWTEEPDRLQSMESRKCQTHLSD